MTKTTVLLNSNFDKGIMNHKPCAIVQNRKRAVLRLFTSVGFLVFMGIVMLSAQNPQGLLMFSATPNPADDKCLVRVYLPVEDKNAEFRIIDKGDSLVQVIPIAGGVGIQSGVINLSVLPIGTYTCQLYYQGRISQSNLIYHSVNSGAKTVNKWDSNSIYKRLADMELRIKDLAFNQEIRREDHLRLDSITNRRIDAIKPGGAVANVAPVDNDSLQRRLRDLNRDVARLRLKIESFEYVMQQLDVLKLSKKKFENPMKKGSTYNLTRIYFNSGNYDFLPKSKQELDDLVSVLTEFPLLAINIMGHTDNVGNYEANMELSRQRAKMVYNYLIGKGVAASRLSYEGFGPNKPFVENITEDDKAVNRRVEFVILKE